MYLLLKEIERFNWREWKNVRNKRESQLVHLRHDSENSADQNVCLVKMNGKHSLFRVAIR